MNLPRGIWYEASKRRYRVRRYRNHITYLAGYFPTLNEARQALHELDRFLEDIPRERRSNSRQTIHVPVGTFGGISQAFREERYINPHAGRIKQF